MSSNLATRLRHGQLSQSPKTTRVWVRVTDTDRDMIEFLSGHFQTTASDLILQLVRLAYSDLQNSDHADAR